MASGISPVSARGDGSAEPRRALNPAQLREAREAFDAFPMPGQQMESKDLKVALITLGFDKLTREDVQRQLQIYGSPPQIDFDTFVQIIERLLPTRDTRAELEEAFRLFDTDNTGRISFRNLKEVCSTLGEQLTEQEIIEIIAEADKRGEGDIDLEEFVALVAENAIF